MNAQHVDNDHVNIPWYTARKPLNLFLVNLLPSIKIILVTEEIIIITHDITLKLN